MAVGQEFRGIEWTNINEWRTCGQWWTDTGLRYDRLPKHAEKTVTPEVWQRSHTPTGMHVLFETNSPKICVRWKLKHEQLNELNFPAAGFSGVDLYTGYKGGFRWISAANAPEGKNNRKVMIDGLSEKKRKYLLYFPLRNCLQKMEIGVPKGYSIKQNHYKGKPLAYYGTSIVHGSNASHAGMVHTAIIGRRLGKEVVNLGFSGVARMEPAMADLLGEIDAGMYVLDTLPNMDTNLVLERTESFIRRLRAIRPKTPVVMIEDRPLGNWWIKPEDVKYQQKKWAEYAKIFRKLKREGDSNLYYIKGEKLFGEDSEAMCDNVHPSDLGYMRMADIVAPVLKKILSGKAK